MWLIHTAVFVTVLGFGIAAGPLGILVALVVLIMLYS